MDDCIFCKIIKGEIEAYKLYEDQEVLVFLDKFPDSPGHTLIIPKKHILDITQMNDEEFKKIGSTSKTIYNLLKQKLNFDGLKVVQNNGMIQEIKHYHMHLIPIYNQKPNASVEEIFEILKK